METKKEQKTVIITEDEFSKKCADVMSSDHLKPILEKAPVLALGYAIFFAELASKIFGDKEE